MLDIIWVGLLCAVYFFAGYAFAIRRMHDKATKIMTEILEENERIKSVKRAALALTHEVIDGVHYFYNHDDNTFVCQGSSLEEAAIAYSARESQKIGVFKSSTDNKLYCFVDGKVVSNDGTIIAV